MFSFNDHPVGTVYWIGFFVFLAICVRWAGAKFFAFRSSRSQYLRDWTYHGHSFRSIDDWRWRQFWMSVGLVAMVAAGSFGWFFAPPAYVLFVSGMKGEESRRKLAAANKRLEAENERQRREQAALMDRIMAEEGWPERFRPSDRG